MQEKGRKNGVLKGVPLENYKWMSAHLLEGLLCSRVLIYIGMVFPSLLPTVLRNFMSSIIS
jgi:hypothetical protein